MPMTPAATRPGPVRRLRQGSVGRCLGPEAGRGQLREGFRYVARTPQLGVPLLMMGLVGMLAYEFQVTLPVFARHVFHGGPST